MDVVGSGNAARLGPVQPDHHPQRRGVHRTRRPAILRARAGPQTCLDWIGTLGLRQDITYHPASHFWPLQWAEAGIFLAVAVCSPGSASGGPAAASPEG